VRGAHRSLQRVIFGCYSRLVLITAGVRTVPPPRALDDRLNIFELRFPSQGQPRFFRRSDQPRRIARAPRFFYCWNRMPGDLPACVDYFSNGSASSRAEIVKASLVRRQR